jgi:hypothetical protein
VPFLTGEQGQLPRMEDGVCAASSVEPGTWLEAWHPNLDHLTSVWLLDPLLHQPGSVDSTSTHGPLLHQDSPPRQPQPVYTRGNHASPSRPAQCCPLGTSPDPNTCPFSVRPQHLAGAHLLTGAKEPCWVARRGVEPHVTRLAQGLGSGLRCLRVTLTSSPRPGTLAQHQHCAINSHETPTAQAQPQHLPGETKCSSSCKRCFPAIVHCLSVSFLEL